MLRKALNLARNIPKAQSMIGGSGKTNRFYTTNPYKISPMDKKVYVKRYLVAKDNGMMSVCPMPAQFVEKETYIAVPRTGYVAVEFIPALSSDYENQITSKYAYEAKKVFALNFRGIGEIISLPTNNITTEDIAETKILTYQSQFDDSFEKVLKLEIQESDKTYNMTYLEIKNESVFYSLSLNLTTAELLVMQKLLEFALPYLVGWHYLGNPQVIINDIKNSQNIDKGGGYTPFTSPTNS